MTEQKESKIQTKRVSYQSPFSGFSSQDLSILYNSNIERGKMYSTFGTFRNTYSNEEESKKGAIDHIILEELKEFRQESIAKLTSLEEASQEIKKLQQQLYENTQKLCELQQQLDTKTQAISNLLTARRNAKYVYYTGVGTGVASGLAGLVFNNLIYAIIGVGIVLTAITGLWEAKKNEW